ncbi:sugar transferase [Streptomyces venezuelae ATCC 10712]
MTAKRAFDVAGGLALLLALSPLIAGIALSVALGGGAVLRRRTVAGLEGRPFTMLTFRTRSPLAALPFSCTSSWAGCRWSGRAR